MKKFSLLFAAMFAFAIIISGCSSSDNDDEKEKKEEEVVDEKEDEDEEEEDEKEVTKEVEEDDEDEEEDEEGKDTSEASGDFDDLIKEMEDITEGEAEVIYENTDGDSTDIEDVHISLNQYVLVELNDFHADFEIPFDDHTDGGVILAEYTIENDTGEDVHYMPDFDISYVGATKSHSDINTLIPDDVQLFQKLGPSNEYELDDGDEETGYIAYAFSPDQLDEILEEEKVEIAVNPAAEDYDSESYDYKPLIGKETKFNVPLGEDGAENVKESGEFYEDRATDENMGDKTMIKEKEDIDETMSLRDSKVTLEGYQFTEFEPNKEEAPRFEDFDEGIVLLTLKMEIENNESDPVGLTSLSSTLDVNNGKGRLLDEGLLLNYNNDDVIEPGDSGEWLQVYIMDKEEYEKMWKDKEFELEVGPLKSDEAKDLSKGQTESIILPD